MDVAREVYAVASSSIYPTVRLLCSIDRIRSTSTGRRLPPSKKSCGVCVRTIAEIGRQVRL